MSLVEGRYMEQSLSIDGAAGAGDPAAPAPPAAAGSARFRDDRFVLTFTPRDPMSGSLRQEQPGDPGFDLPSLRISMSSGGAEADRLNLMNIGSMPGLGLAPGGLAAETETLSLGGAVELNDWSLGASFLQSSGFGEQAKVAGATVGYGKLTTRLAIGEQSTIYERADRDFWLFSTNLAARPWMSLEGDLGFTPQQQDTEQSTIGRVGVRLKF